MTRRPETLDELRAAVPINPPKRWRSWRVCPACGSRATKIFSMTSGQYQCQICDHEYDWPHRRQHSRGA